MLVPLSSVTFTYSVRLGKDKPRVEFPAQDEKAYHVPSTGIILLQRDDEHIVIPIAHALRWTYKDLNTVFGANHD